MHTNPICFLHIRPLSLQPSPKIKFRREKKKNLIMDAAVWQWITQQTLLSIDLYVRSPGPGWQWNHQHHPAPDHIHTLRYAQSFFKMRRKKMKLSKFYQKLQSTNLIYVICFIPNLTLYVNFLHLILILWISIFTYVHTLNAPSLLNPYSF